MEKIEHVFTPNLASIPRVDACLKCGLPEVCHRPSRLRDTRKRGPRPKRPYKPRDCKLIGIDGEGVTRCYGCKAAVDGPQCAACGSEEREHVYTLLAACDETGARVWHKANYETGLSIEDCFEFLLELPYTDTKCFAYSFNYDLTKWLERLPNKLLYDLCRPENRRYMLDGRAQFRPVLWGPPEEPDRYSINMMQTSFTLRRKRGVKLRRDGKEVPVYGEPRIIRDVWKFFQGKFVAALTDWKVGNEKLWERMTAMKDSRSDFASHTPESILAYCLEECLCMAQLVKKLIQAHLDVGLVLKRFDGAGSSAAAMMSQMGIKEHIKEHRALQNVPEAMEEPIACGFFGGRFENGWLGPIDGEVWSNDISSAYPYHLCFLPCLLHGSWIKTKSRAEAEHARAALVRYTLKKSGGAWGPFPFRLATGSIVFPEVSGGGWIWQDEYFAGEKHFQDVKFKEAWVYDCVCDCKPFSRIPEFYRERLRIGKEGPGIVIKLGCNSCYGKLAQSLGGMGPFTSWIWAGLITSGCRAQVLDAMGLHRDRSNLLMVATDGIISRERLALATPRDTGTWDCVDDKGKLAGKPLGGWEEKLLPRGVFLARPGIYFPVNPTKEEIKQVRARGVGRAVVLEHHARIVATYHEALRTGTLSTAKVKVDNLSRFLGAKSSITKSTAAYNRSESYGKWLSRPVEMGFDPLPKREGVGKHGELGLRSFPGMTSKPYKRGLFSEEARELKLLTEEANEQPDGGDYCEGMMFE